MAVTVTSPAIRTGAARRPRTILLVTLAAAGLGLGGCHSNTSAAGAPRAVPVSVKAATPAVTPAPAKPVAAPKPAALRPVVKPRTHPHVVRHIAPAPKPAAKTQTMQLGGGWSVTCTGGYLQSNGVCTSRPGGYQPPPAPAAAPCMGTATECLNAMFGGDVQNDIPTLMGGR